MITEGQQGAQKEEATDSQNADHCDDGWDPESPHSVLPGKTELPLDDEGIAQQPTNLVMKGPPKLAQH